MYCILLLIQKFLKTLSGTHFSPPLIMLAFIGFIALLIFGKFLWDTYATGKTDKDWESYKKQEPEKAARIVNSATFDMSTNYKSNPVHQQISLNMIAALFECDASEAEETYKKAKREELAIDLGNVEKFKQEMNEARQHKYKQAVSMEFDPNNTPAAFLERWMQEVLDEASKPSIVINANAKDYLTQANDAISKKNHEEAVQLLEEALLQTDKKSRHYIHNVIGEYYLALDIETKAITHFKEALHSVALFESNNEAIWKIIKSNQDTAYFRYYSKYNESIRANSKPLNEPVEDIGGKTKMNEQTLAEAGAKAMAVFGIKVKKIEEPGFSAKDYLTQAQSLASNNQHKESMTLISDTISMIASGELFNDRLLKPHLINALGESQLALGEFSSAGISFEVAINLTREVEPDNEEALNKFISNRDKAGKAKLVAEETAKFFASVGSAFGEPKQAQLEEPVANASEESTDKAQMSADAMAQAVSEVKTAFTRKAPELESESEVVPAEVNEEEDELTDYEKAIAARLAARLAAKAEARLLAKEAIKAALKAAKAVVAPVVEPVAEHNHQEEKKVNADSYDKLFASTGAAFGAKHKVENDEPDTSASKKSFESGDEVIL